MEPRLVAARHDEFPYVARGANRTEVIDIAAKLDDVSIVLAGPAGVGKSRLAREVVGASNDTPILHAVATAAAAQIPFAALSDLVPAEDFGGDPGRLFRAVARSLRARSRGRPLLLIDDAHLLDPGSAALVLHLVSTSRIRLIATVRTPATPPDAVLALWKDGWAERLEVVGLDELEMARFAEHALGGPTTVWLRTWLGRRTAGNPLEMRELLRAALDSGVVEWVHGIFDIGGDPILPGRYADLVRPRLEALSADERSALELVAFGEPLRWGVARDVAGVETLLGLEAKGEILTTLVADELTVRTRHPLLGELLRGDSSPAASASRRAVLANAWLDGDPTDAELLLAATWRLDDLVLMTVDQLCTAAEAACRMCAPALGGRLARAAVAEGGGAKALLIEARAALEAGDPDGALAAAESALDLGGLPALARRRALRLQILAAVRLDRGEQAAGALDRYGSSTAEQAFVSAVTVVLRANEGDHHGAVATGSGLGLPGAGATIGFAITPLTWARLQVGDGAGALQLVGPEPPPSEAFGERARSEFESWIIVQVELMTDLAAADAYALEVLRTAAAVGDRALAGSAAAQRGRIALLRGRPRTAAHHLQEARRHFSESDPGRVKGIADAWLVVAHGLLGRADEDGLATATQSMAVAPGWIRNAAFLARAEVWAACGDPSRAGRIALDAADRFAGVSVIDESTLLHDAIRLGLRDDVIADRLAAMHGDLPAIALRARHAAAVVGSRPGDLMEVCGELEALGADLWASEVAADAAAALTSHGRPGPARAAWARSRLLGERCEGARTPALQWPTGLSTLTARQREVVRLVAQGLSNAAIAARLTLSVRTVESHIYRATERLGVTDRHELAAILGAAPAGGLDVSAARRQ